jgi:uncharacterized Tic20 family protein
MVMWIIAIPTGFVGPLVIYLVKKDESKFIAYHARMALLFELLSLPLIVVTVGLFQVVNIVIDILWCLKANEGRWDRVPIVGRWVWPEDLPPPDDDAG